MKMRAALSMSLSLLMNAGRTAAPVVVAAACLVACADENDPKTWVKRLDDPLQRSKAVANLKAMFETKLTAAKTKMGNDPTALTAAANAPTEYDDADVKGLLDIIVDPLTKLY